MTDTEHSGAGVTPGVEAKVAALPVSSIELMLGGCLSNVENAVRVPGEDKVANRDKTIQRAINFIRQLRADNAALNATIYGLDFDSIMTMPDEQLKAEIRASGHNPDDTATIVKQGFEIAHLRVKLAATLSDVAEVDALRAQVARLRAVVDCWRSVLLA